MLQRHAARTGERGEARSLRLGRLRAGPVKHMPHGDANMATGLDGATPDAVGETKLPVTASNQFRRRRRRCRGDRPDTGLATELDGRIVIHRSNQWIWGTLPQVVGRGARAVTYT